MKKDGYLIVAMPNLASYINRIGLLFGYQPRDVELSRYTSAQGFLPIYGGDWIGHVHSATLRAIKSLLGAYGFSVIKVTASNPYAKTGLIRILDKLFSTTPGLSRRFIILAKKSLPHKTTVSLAESDIEPE